MANFKCIDEQSHIKKFLKKASYSSFMSLFITIFAVTHTPTKDIAHITYQTKFPHMSQGCVFPKANNVLWYVSQLKVIVQRTYLINHGAIPLAKQLMICDNPNTAPKCSVVFTVFCVRIRFTLQFGQRAVLIQQKHPTNAPFQQLCPWEPNTQVLRLFQRCSCDP